jgi:RNA polymerase-associated protein
VPVLVERDLVLTEANIINEYIDERFPHPQLMPADPVMRGRARLFLHRFEQELYSNVNIIMQGGKTADKARAIIRDNLTQLAQILTKQKYLLGNDFSMLDVAVAPLLWRLDHYGIQLGKDAAPMLKYSERLFSRQGFIDSLTPAERAMRK